MKPLALLLLAACATTTALPAPGPPSPPAPAPIPSSLPASASASAPTPDPSPPSVPAPPSDPVSPTTIGLLLPLSGKHAKLGRELSAAVRTALAADPDSAALTVDTVDTTGDATTAAAAFDALVARSHPLFVLGPVGEKETDAVLARARALGVPLLALGPGFPAPGLVRLLSGPADRARALVIALSTLSPGRLGLLAPADPAGDAALDAAQREAAARKLDVARTGRYAADGKTLEQDLRTFFGLDPTTNPRLAAHLRKYGKGGWRTFSPDIDTDVLLILDDAKRAPLIAAFLPFMNIELRTGYDDSVEDMRRRHGGRLPTRVQLAGPATWHDPALLAARAEALEGALVADGCDALAEQPTGAALKLAEAVEAAVGRAPARATLETHDGVRLALAARRRALAASHGRTDGLRDAFLHALTSVVLPDDAAACGPARLAPGNAGVVERPAKLYRVQGTAFVEEDAP